MRVQLAAALSLRSIFMARQCNASVQDRKSTVRKAGYFPLHLHILRADTRRHPCFAHMEDTTLDQDYLNNHNWSPAEIEAINQAISGLNRWGKIVRRGHYLLITLAVLALLITLIIFQSANNSHLPEVGQMLSLYGLLFSIPLVLSAVLYRKNPTVAIAITLALYLFLIFQNGVTSGEMTSTIGSLGKGGLKVGLAFIFIYLLYASRKYKSMQARLSELGFAPSTLLNAWRKLKSIDQIPTT